MKCVTHFIFIIAISFFHNARPKRSVFSLPVDPNDLSLGMTVDHIKKLQVWVNTNKVALFIRKSEPDTVRLIKDGKFGTKSVDIHNKSSNWGPQRGTVPVDPFFSKKVGKPNGQYGTVITLGIKEKREKTDHIISHAIAEEQKMPEGMRNGVDTIELVISDALLKEYLQTGLLKFAKGKCGALEGEEDMCVKENAANWNGKLAKEAIDARFLLDNMVTVAGEVQWKVYAYITEKKHLEPVTVWAYTSKGKKAAVTGDYDLWLVAPHIKSPLIQGVTDEDKYKDIACVTTQNIKGGKTTVTPFDYRMINGGPDGKGILNSVCHREDFPVFHHGSEMKNYGFLQELDKIIYILVPEAEPAMMYAVDDAGKQFQPLSSGLVRDGAIPQIFSALRRFGYFLMPNPLHGFKDPTYGGKTEAEVITKMKQDGESAEMIEAFHKAYLASAQYSHAFIDKQRRYANPLDRTAPMVVKGSCTLAPEVYKKLFSIFTLTYDLRIKQAGLMDHKGGTAMANQKENGEKSVEQLIAEAVKVWKEVVPSATCP